MSRQFEFLEFLEMNEWETDSELSMSTKDGLEHVFR